MLYQDIDELYKKFRLQHYQNLFKRIREKAGSLSATEAYAVDVIYLLQNPTIKQFSDYLHISQPNATYKINSLVSKGYILKEPSDGDRREYRLTVAEKFHQYYDGGNQFIAEAVSRLEGSFSQAELALFSRMLRVIIQTVKQPIPAKTPTRRRVLNGSV